MKQNKQTYYYDPTSVDPFGDNFFDLDDDDDVRCQCGAESVYGSETNLHSTWCQKFKKFKDEKMFK